MKKNYFTYTKVYDRGVKPFADLFDKGFHSLATCILLALFMCASVTLRAQYGEIVLFASPEVNTQAEVYSAKWTDQTTGILPQNVFCERFTGTPFNVKTPQGKDVQALKFKAVTDNCDGEAEMSIFSIAFNRNSDSYKNSVFIYTVFDEQAKRDLFINNNAGSLPWATLEKGNVPAWFSYSDHHQRFSHGGTAPDFPSLTMRWGYQDPSFIVMEEQPYKRNAVAINAKMLYPVTLEWELLANGTWKPYFTTPLCYDNSGLMNQIEVTYTNTAPYPVLFAALEPQINRSSCSFDADRLATQGLKFEYKGIFDGDAEENNHTWAMSGFDGGEMHFMPIVLMPHESRKLTWEVGIVNNGQSLPNMVEPNRSFNFIATVYNYTTSPYVLVERGGAEIITATVEGKLPGTADDQMAVLASHPEQFNSESDLEKILTLEIQGVNKLGKIIFGNSADGHEKTEVLPEHITYDGGLVKINIHPYAGTRTGSFYLQIYNNRGELRKWVYMYNNPNVGITSPSLLERRFVITQNPETQKFRYTGYFNTDLTYGGETVLLDITSALAERDLPTDPWKLNPQVTVNTLLASDNKGYFTLNITPDEVLFEPHDGATLYHTGEYMQYENNNEDGLGTRLTPADGDYRIRLTSDELYNNAAPLILDGENDEYPEEWTAPVIETSHAFSVNVLGEYPFAEMKNPVLYRDEISLSGSLNIAALLPYDLMKSFLDVDLQIHDFRLGNKRKMLGARGDFSGFVGINDPFGMFSVGANLDIHVNNLPENLNKKIGASGEMGISMLGGVSGEITFAPAEDNQWFLDDIYASISAPIPFLPCPIIQISKLGLGVHGIASTYHQYSDAAKGNYDKGFIPDFHLKGTLGLGFADNDIVGIEGTGNIGTTIGLTDGEFELFMLKILTDVTLTGQYVNSRYGSGGDGLFYITTKGGKEIPLPMTALKFDMGGTLNVLNIIIGNVEGYFLADPGALTQMLPFNPTTQQIQDLVNEVVQAILDGDFDKQVTVYSMGGLMSGKKKIRDVMWDIIDFALKGKIGVYIPENLPLGGQQLLNAGGAVDKSSAFATAGARIKVGITWKGKFYGLDKEVTASIKYYFKEKRQEWNFGLRAAPMMFAGMPEYDRRYTTANIEGRSLQFSSPNFVPMIKNGEIRSGGTMLRSFSDEWSASKTQTMTDISKGFSIAVRSKSNTTGLLLTCTSGDFAGLTAEYTAADIDWKQSENGEYYYGTVMLEIPSLPTDLDESSTGTIDDLEGLTLAGDWKVDAYNAGVTVIDPAGLIDCDFFYMVNPASISTFTYAADNTDNNITWTSADLVDGASYRMNFTLVNAADSTLTYYMGATPQWLGDNPTTAFTMPIDTLLSMTMLPTGDYYLNATLEKHDGYYTLVDDPTEDDILHDFWLTQSEAKSAAFTHVNALQPTYPVTNLGFYPSANGRQKYFWTLPADMTNVDGFHAFVQDITTGETLATYDLPNDATELTVTAAAPPTGEASASQVLFDTTYDLTIVPYHRFDNIVTDPDDSSKKDTLSTYLDGTDAAKKVVLLSISAPQQPKIARIYRGTATDKTEKLLAGDDISDFLGILPADIAGLDVILRADHLLTLAIPTSNMYFNSANISLSEEMGQFAKNNTTGGTPTYTDITTATVIPNDRVEIPFAGMTEGVYLLECKLNSGNDYNIYRFNIFIDNTPPMLVASSKMQTEEGIWVVSGVTERNLAAFVFNGDSIDVPNGTFTLPVAADISSLSISATDIAGNTSVLEEQLRNIPQLPDGDTTAAVKIDSTFAKVKLDAMTITATAKVLRDGSFIVIPEADASYLTWSVVLGEDVLDIDENTGLITPKTEGTATIQATYAGVLVDVTAISVAEEFPVSDLYVSELLNADRTELRLSFTEPQDATGKTLEASTDLPVEGEVLTGWTTVSATFDDAGHATLTVPDADKTYYFRLIVIGGLNEGVSNVAGKMGKLSSDIGTITEVIEVRIDDAVAITLYPNPASDYITLNGVAAGSTITVYNATGTQVIDRKVVASPVTLIVAHLPAGVYVVRITDGKTIKTGKLIIEK